MKLAVGTVQLRSVRGRVRENLKEAGRLLERCAAQGAELVVLPELFATGYFWDEELHKLITQSFSETVGWLKERAAKHGMVIIAGVGEPVADGFYDSAILTRPSGEVEIYRKTHLFRDEVKYFQAGDRLLVAGTGETELKVGLLICVEVGFPEPARALALEGAELIVIPMAFGAARGPTIYETATRARALENNLFLITANQVGCSGEFDFYGHSRVVSPLGEVLLDLEEEGCGVAELDLTLVGRCRRGELDRAYPYLRERRPELYSRLAEPSAGGVDQVAAIRYHGDENH